MQKSLLLSVLLAAAVFVLSFADTTWAQPPRRGGGFSASPLSLLRQESVQRELELVEDQKEKLAAITDAMRSSMREVYSGLRDLSPEERREKFASLRDDFRQLAEEAEAKVDEMLLPHQKDRLQQITLQARLQRQGTVSALTSDALADTLNLSEEQQKMLREKEAEVREELREKIEKLREDAREELLGVLTTAQRQQLEQLLGKDFDTDNLGRGASARPRRLESEKPQAE